ncbi:MAG: ABC transporter ATP-binding protein [Nitrososphaerales archaeon]
MEKILIVKDLHKSFGGLKALNGVNLHVVKGEILGLIGPNGSGKSTLFNVISGLLKPDKGHIQFMGKHIGGLEPSEIYRLGIVRSFQNPRLYTGLTVLENLLVPPKDQLGERMIYAPLKFKWKEQEKNLGADARGVGGLIELNNVIYNLARDISGGQMKLLELGRALMGEPKLVLLDEPTAGVLPKLAENIFTKINELRAKYDLTFFIIEHRLDILFKYVDRVYVMHQGSIIAEGTPPEVTQNKEVIEVYLGG